MQSLGDTDESFDIIGTTIRPIFAASRGKNSVEKVVAPFLAKTNSSDVQALHKISTARNVDISNAVIPSKFGDDIQVKDELMLQSKHAQEVASLRFADDSPVSKLVYVKSVPQQASFLSDEEERQAIIETLDGFTAQYMHGVNQSKSNQPLSTRAMPSQKLSPRLPAFLPRKEIVLGTIANAAKAQTVRLQKKELQSTKPTHI